MTIDRRRADRESIFQYKVDLALGSGGTGTVYRGQDPETREIVAIKVFRANFFRNALHVRSLTKMVKKAKKLEHPNVVSIHEFINDKETQALVMEYVDGPDLKYYMENRPWNLEERLVVAAQICNGLAHLHDNKLLHHDLKPANVLFTRRGQVKLCDYSLYGESLMRGLLDGGFSEQITPMYVAPEIVERKKGTALTDLYSLGVLFYVMFAEKVPFQVDTLQQLYYAHVHTDPLHPSIHNAKCPQPLGDLIMRLLSKKPAKRVQTVQQLRIAMSEIGRSRI